MPLHISFSLIQQYKFETDFLLLLLLLPLEQTLRFISKWWMCKCVFAQELQSFQCVICVNFRDCSELTWISSMIMHVRNCVCFISTIHTYILTEQLSFGQYLAQLLQKLHQYWHSNHMHGGVQMMMLLNDILSPAWLLIHKNEFK